MVEETEACVMGQIEEQAADAMTQAAVVAVPSLVATTTAELARAGDVMVATSDGQSLDIGA